MQTKPKVNTHEFTRKALGLAIAKDRGSLIALLKKFGANVDNKISDDELIISLLVANRTNSRFRESLKEILKTNAKERLNSFTGEDKFFGVVPVPEDEPATHDENASATTTKTKTAFGSFLSNNLDSILNNGLNILSTSLTNKSNQKLADTALAVETEKTKQAALLAGGGGGSANTPKGIIGATIALVIGILAVAGIGLYFVLKKK